MRKLVLHDRDLLGGWQGLPHVARWWDQDAPHDAHDPRDARVARRIVSLGDHPFAFMQDDTVHGWGDHHFAHLPQGAGGINPLIGDSPMPGGGHGTRLIAQRMRALFDAGAPVIATDPHPDNTRAIAVYTKPGFRPAGPARPTRSGRLLPMLADAGARRRT